MRLQRFLKPGKSLLWTSVFWVIKFNNSRHNKLYFIFLLFQLYVCSSLHPLCHKCTRLQSCLHATCIRTIVTEKRKFLNGKRQRKTEGKRLSRCSLLSLPPPPFSNLQFFDGIILDGETWKEKLSSAASFSSSGSFQLILELSCCKKLQKKVPTKKLVWSIRDV